MAKVTHSASHIDDKLQRREMREMYTRFRKHIQIFKSQCYFEQPNNITFHVKLSSSSHTFDYQLVDATWTQQLLAAAQRKQFTDVEFLVDGKVFAAHRFIVSSRSSVFAAMFSDNGMVENNAGTVTINDTDPDVFETFLKFLYTGTLEPFSLADDDGLRALADKYQVDTLVSVCQSFTPKLSKEDMVNIIMPHFLSLE